MHGQGGVVGLNDSVGDLWRWDNGEGSHHAVWEFLTDLGDEQGAHTSTSTTTERMGDLETLKAVTALSLAAYNIKNLVDKFGTFGVMTLSPVVTSTRLAKDEVVGTEELAKRTRTDGVHGSGLKIDEDGTRDELIARCLRGVRRV
jgi:hypothetical protein